jgi:Delta3-Delta2-enoyl-CoA isomerase
VLARGGPRLPDHPRDAAVIAAKVPRRSAQEAVLTGRRYGGPEAAAAGIVHQVASEDQVLARAIQLAAELAAKDRRTIAEHKRMLYGEAIEAIGREA